MNISLHYFITRACDLYSHIFKMMCYQRKCESSWVTNICIQFIPWIFLVILSCNYGSRAAEDCRPTELYIGANLYISIIMPKGTIHKCDKNSLLKTGASGNTCEFNVLFSEYFSLLIINYGTFTFQFRMQHRYLYLHGNVTFFSFLYQSSHVHYYW